MIVKMSGQVRKGSEWWDNEVKLIVKKNGYMGFTRVEGVQVIRCTRESNRNLQGVSAEMLKRRLDN